MLKTALSIASILIVFFIADYLGPFSYLHEWKYVMVVFFAAISFLLHTLVGVGIDAQSDKFIIFYLTSVIIRFLACIIFVVVSLHMDVGNVAVFIINFFALYLFFTSFEILGLYRNLRRF
ncbi:MAG: hypothetical protein ACI9QN_000145 [Arcticibacterium sp.]|jgi:hypothetical protein